MVTQDFAPIMLILSPLSQEPCFARVVMLPWVYSKTALRHAEQPLSTSKHGLSKPLGAIYHGLTQLTPLECLGPSLGLYTLRISPGENLGPIPKEATRLSLGPP